MAKAFNKIFWGSLLVFFNFYINNFDILPNFLGYLFIYLGLTGLMSYSDQFSKAKTYVLILGVVSIPLIYQFEAHITEQIEMTTNTYILMAIYMVVAFVQLGFVYHFMRGLLEIAQVAPFTSLEKKTGTLLRFYIILTIVTQIISLLILISHAFALSLAPIILVLAIVSFIVEIILLVLIRQFRSKSLEQDMN
ncbi:hypothetical protein FQ087_11790 [Sporosarcina sp. ANT_H38]|uniref:hypothetical protein n=1 Tax=Sporosarcina sp. ANT_H38 TaxID=2597358 RepID=UPI0011F3359A|nr:hypothetical protein [Sporosarcina sp. ANT_H38]KAA0966864.1 hypothetical protein FQ087_11790 [Sporosarcina sp. ANT_H38]